MFNKVIITSTSKKGRPVYLSFDPDLNVHMWSNCLGDAEFLNEDDDMIKDQLELAEMIDSNRRLPGSVIQAYRVSFSPLAH